MITGIIEVTQDPEQAGSTLKILSLRLRGMKGQLEELGEETDENVENISKMQGQILNLTKGKVNIFDGAGEFRSTYEIMQDISEVWDDLNSTAQADLLETIAGKHRANSVAALMSNWENVEAAVKSASEAEGSAVRENAKYVDSIQGRLDKMTTSWQSFANTFMSSDFLKGGISFITNLIEKFEQLIKTVGTLPTLIGAFAGGLSALKNKGLFTFDKDVKSIKLLGTGLTDLKSKYSQVQTAIDRYNSLSSKSASFQEKYNKHLANSSTSMGKYLKGLNGAKASFGGYIGSLIGATVKTVALEAATIALNAALTMGISALISFGIKVLDSMIVTADELAEKVEEVTSKYKEQHSELKKLKGDYDTSNEDSMVSKYEKLSKGVDSLGRNVSLTADEYSEYQGIVSKIAEQIPSLVQGYDSQGNAILSCKGNVEELTTAYQKLIHAQNTEILSNAGNIEENFANILEKFSGEHGQSDGHGFWKGLITSGSGEENFVQKFFDYELKGDTVKSLEKLLDGSGKYNKDDVFKELKNNTFSESEIRTLLKNADVDIDYSDDAYEVLEETLKTNPAKIKNAVDNYYTQFADAIEEEKTIAQAKLSEAFDVSDTISGLNYGNISEELQQIAYQTVNSLDFDFFSELSKNGQSFGDWIDNMLDQLNSISKTDSAQIEAAFELQTKFNGGDISYGEYVRGIQNTSDLIDGLDLSDEVKSQIKMTLNTDEVTDNYDALKNRLTSEEFGIKMSTEEAEKYLSKLSESEYQVAINLIDDKDIDFNDFDSIKELRAYIKKEAELLEAMNFTIAMDIETESLTALNTAIAESVSGAGLSSEAIAALKSRYAELEGEGYNLSAMFEETANGIHLNKEAVGELEQKLASDKLAETDKQLEVLKGRYDELATEINNCTDASDRAALYTEQQSIVDKINDLATLASQYEGLTSAYNTWIAAEEAGSERDMYEGIIEGFETVGDEISRGWVDDGTIKFLELLTGKTGLAGKSGKELKKIYDDLDDTIKNTTYSVRDFFTVDEDGNSTNTGVYNFLDAVGQLEEEKFGGKDVVKRDKDGNVIGFDFEIVAKKDKNGNVIKNGDQVVAEALGISEELVQIMVRASDDAGFVVNLEGAYTQLADLKTEAESARDTLISLQKNGLAKLKGVDVDFDLEAEGNDLLEEQAKAVELLNKFKDKNGKIDLKMEGAQQALDIAEYLTIKLDDLTEPKIMQIDVSEVDEDLRDPIEKMQEIVNLSKEKNLVSLTGDKREIQETQNEINKVAKELEELDPEIKAQVGIDENWDAETIASKIEKGEVEIPAELELDVQMSDDLKDMRLMMMNQLGLVSDDEVKLKVGFDIDESVVDGLTDEQKEIVVKYLAEHEEVDDYTPEQKEALVKYMADGGNLDDYTPEEKQGIVKYLADGGDITDYTPEQKQAIVEYLTDSGDPDNWTPEQKEAVAKFKKDSAEVDNYSPEDKQAIAKFIKNSIEPDTYQPPNKTQNVTANLDSSEPDNYQPKDKKFTVKAVLQKIGDWTNKLLSGGSKRKMVNGTANVDGTALSNGTTGRAFKHGDWSTKDSGDALVGELGTETLVRNGRYYTIGDTGAEFIHYEKGDIIFNHKQTEELFRYGKVASGGGRGRALASGTAFPNGSTGSSGSGGGLKVGGKSVEIKTDSVKVESKTSSTKSSSSSSKSSSKSKTSSSSSSSSKSKSEDTAEEFEETFDLIEIAISRIEREIDNLDQKANRTYKSWSSRNTALTSEISKVGDEINLQQKAYNKYMAAANAVGLSSSWENKVKNGQVDISTIKDEALAEKIKDFQTWYEKALACKDAIEDLKDTEAELYKQRFDNIQAQYDGILQGYEHTETMLNEYIAQAEAQGHIVSKKYYDALISNEKSNIAQLKKEQSALIKSRDQAVASGKITKYSQDWIDMSAAIDEVTQSIESGNTELIEYANNIEEINKQIYELKQNKFSNIIDEADFLTELLSYEDLHDDNGKLTDAGMATMGLHGQKQNIYMYKADEAAAEAARLKKIWDKDKSDTEAELAYYNAIAEQYDYILKAKQEEQEMIDLIKEGADIELDALQERINKYEESLDSAKDLYEYQKKIAESTKEVSDIEKTLSAYEGDTSEEARAKIQELRVSLDEAKQNLEEQQYDKYISDQKALLDSLYLEYEQILNERIDNQDALLAQIIESVNLAASEEGGIATKIGTTTQSIDNTLTKQANEVGVKLSSTMNDIWATGDGNIKSVLTTYSSNFNTKSTTIITTLNGIKVSVDKMVTASNKEAEKKTTANKTTTSAKKDPTKTTTTTPKKTTTTPKKTTTTKKSSGDGKAKVGDKVKFVSGQYYYDSQGKKPLGSKNRGKEVYITSINTKSWATHPYHISTGKKLGSGDLGWLKLNQISGYASGKKNFLNNEIAWTQENGQEFIIRPSDGAILTPVAKGDSVLNATASGNIWSMANNPAEFIKNNLGLDSANIPNGSNVNNTYSQHIDSVVFRMDGVKNYDEMLAQMQKDKNFERLVLSMSINQIAGGSKLAKGKSIR